MLKLPVSSQTATIFRRHHTRAERAFVLRGRFFGAVLINPVIAFGGILLSILSTWLGLFVRDSKDPETRIRLRVRELRKREQ